MTTLLQVIRNRLLPAILTGAGVAIIVTGVLWYGGPVDAGPDPTPDPTASAISPTATPTTTARASPSGEASPSPSGLGRVATRVQVPALRIDLPVIRQPAGPTTYPLCNVAMYLDAPQLGQPGEGRATYLYAHAREGMFLPILQASQVNDGVRMKGMIVNVYTSDDQLFLYEIVEVRRHQTVLTDALNATTDQLWLQTSEGPKGTPGKTQVIARLLSTGPADHTLANPVPKPLVCG